MLTIEEMEDIDNLNYSFLEQFIIQLSRLKDEMDDEEPESSYSDKHRLFRKNPYEDIGIPNRQHLDQLLHRSLITLGGSIDTQGRVQVIDRRHLGNYVYEKNGVIRLKPKEEIKFSVCAPRKSYLMLHVVAKIINLIQYDKYMTNRELYYNSKEICSSRICRLNRVVDDLCCLLGCSRVHLRILCQSKGLIFGPLKFKLKTGEVFDCLESKEGTKLPTPQIPIVDIESDAKFIMIVEKDSVLQKILNQEETTNFIEKYKPILFTAKGYPDVNSRAFLNLLWRKLKIPIFALTDADPHGVDIACCYKFGCYGAASEASYLALPQMKWLGLLPVDVEKHDIPESSLINLTDNDIKKIESMLKKPSLQKRPDWLSQISLIREMNKKAELESIDTQGDYLTRTYLPNKLRYASWL